MNTDKFPILPLTALIVLAAANTAQAAVLAQYDLINGNVTSTVDPLNATANREAAMHFLFKA